MKEIELFALDEGIENIAVVDRPAIEVNFLCFAKEETQELVFANEERQELVGAFLIPDKRMLRYDENNEPYKVFFSKETVAKIAHEFLGNRQFNIGHNEDTDRLVLQESWIKTTDQDKSTALGLNVPIGTWLGCVKVNDNELWQKIKEGEYNGFSIAGEFIASKSQDFAAQEDSDTMLLNQIRTLIEQCDE